jgi:hypothetical protein
MNVITMQCFILGFTMLAIFLSSISRLCHLRRSLKWKPGAHAFALNYSSINTDSGSQPIDGRTLSKQDAVEQRRCLVEPFGSINETDISGMDSGVVRGDFAL